MQAAHDRSEDPRLATLALTSLFLAVCLWRVATPSIAYFDEVHYLPAARALLDGSEWINAEHPPLGKHILAAGIAIFGDNPFGWRFFPALFGAIALYAFSRALWEASRLRFATLAYCWLLGTGFQLIVQARIAMLDIFMVAFFALALWQLARAVRAPEEGRKRLALAGLALGAAMASKWNAVPLAMLPGMAFLGARFMAGRRRLLVSKRGAPVPGVSLLEATVWLGAVPLAVYFASFVPVWMMAEHPFGDRGLIGIQQMMLEMQQSVKQPHPYQSTWAQWITNTRGIWYLYEEVDGAYRGVLLIGNPFTMLAGLPALLWCGWVALAKKRIDALAVAVLFAASFGFWIVAAKPIQFYYHYLLPSCFLLAALALALDALKQRGMAPVSYATLAASAAFFVFFFPVLTAMKLQDSGSFVTWTWIEGWR
ncbi:phospholipid carrier-dependent glycosyltransferase [Parerythrobacter aestuarii]|uniref:phospholipid carrier-dependent glycosyltransferase n=1 Tax=Parerythrobacter aestuarii TaxID=3020909 RepID=UPI0024DE39D6|nr:phospholipid carrier-dependent glycosyltransferase [Parerythrobacter aestuarii]